MSYSYYRRPRWQRFLGSDLAGPILGVLFFLFACAGCLWFNYWINASYGTGGYGPVRQYSVVVVSKHIDAQDDSSSYMVTTDVGTFEVDNGPLLDVWNADVIYGNIVPGQHYCFTAKGNTVTNWYMQQYPYIQKVVPGGC